MESRLPSFNPGGFNDTYGVFTLAHDEVRELKAASYSLDYLTRSVRRASGFVLVRHSEDNET